MTDEEHARAAQGLMLTLAAFAQMAVDKAKLSTVEGGSGGAVGVLLAAAIHLTRQELGIDGAEAAKYLAERLTNAAAPVGGDVVDDERPYRL